MKLERQVSWRNGEHKRALAVVAVVTVGALVFWGAHVVVNQADWVADSLRSTTRAVGRQLAPECVRDDDCVLRPSLITCCGTCPAARPYEAVSARQLQQILRDADDACAPTSRVCEPPVCPPLDLGAEVYAVCTAGACQAVELPAAWIARRGGTTDASSEQWRSGCLD